jgi:methionyl-tRNA formyltransferase
VPQDESRASWAPKLTTADGELHFTDPSDAVARRVRAMNPEPGAWTVFRGQRLGVLRAVVTGGRGVQHGTLELRDGVPHVAAGAGWLRLDLVKPAGKRAMSGAEWARGLRLDAADRLGPS